MKTVYPTPTGYESDPMRIADLIFSNSLLARASQTDVFFNAISALDKVMKENINNSMNLKNEIAEMYQTLFERFFDSAEVITALREDPKFGNAQIIDISITYTNDNFTRRLAETVIYLNGKSKKLSELING